MLENFDKELMDSFEEELEDFIDFTFFNMITWQSKRTYAFVILSRIEFFKQNNKSSLHGFLWDQLLLNLFQRDLQML